MMKLSWIGPMTYIVGIIIALLAGFVAPQNAAIMLVLGILGILVALLNVTDKELMLFLVSSLVFIIGGSSLSSLITGLNLPAGASSGLVGALNYLVVFVAPGAALIALIALYKLSKD